MMNFKKLGKKRGWIVKSETYSFFSDDKRMRINVKDPIKIFDFFFYESLGQWSNQFWIKYAENHKNDGLYTIEGRFGFQQFIQQFLIAPLTHIFQEKWIESTYVYKEDSSRHVLIFMDTIKITTNYTT